METKIHQYRTKVIELIEQLRDVRVVGLIMFLVVLLLISYSGVKVIETNYTLQRQISELDQKKQLQELTNTNLKLTNDYYNTNQYLELMARQNFGKAAPGETVIVVPKSVALAHTIDKPNTDASTTKETDAKQPTYQRNFQAWIDFLFHRTGQ
jgi:cell division protein FtsB